MATSSEIAFLKSTLRLRVSECAALRKQIKDAETKTKKPAAKPTATGRNRSKKG